MQSKHEYMKTPAWSLLVAVLTSDDSVANMTNLADAEVTEVKDEFKTG